eukprot:GFUD01008635.1.p1 GENE.GFUD01008635.1~~GFUD01008635.1.p1  ORF type:complete len:329 (+),score=89.43 GFUD01008635.1:265-1251(+)
MKSLRNNSRVKIFGQCLGVGFTLTLLFVLQSHTADYLELSEDKKSDARMKLLNTEPLIKGEDIFDQYLRKLKSTTLNSTLDCILWTPVSISPHPYKLPDRTDNVKVEEKSYKSESSGHRKDSFVEIYAKNAWGKESKSGPGSLLPSTIRIRNILDLLVEKLKTHLNKDKIRILDSSCGDMTWMPTFLRGRTDVIFTGFDIVPDNIENHRNKFKDENWNFEVHDIVTDSLNSTYDLILSRHTTQHLKTADVLKVIHNFIASGSKYFLTTNYPQATSNKDLEEDSQYRHRLLNLVLGPFYLPPPICAAKDVDTDSIALWDLSTVSLAIGT